MSEEAKDLAASVEETTVMVAQIEREREEQRVEALAVRREFIMATLLAGYVEPYSSDDDTSCFFIHQDDINEARVAADAIMKAAR